MKLLIIADPSGTSSMTALRKYRAEDITVWENDPRHIYTINQICDRINVTTDLDELDSTMHFDLVIGNPPYSDRSNASASGDGGIGVSLDDKFTLKALEHSDDVRLIIRAKHFSKVQSNFRKKLFSSGHMVSIKFLPDDTFAIQNTETCVIHIKTDHKGPCKITYKTGEVRDVELTKDTIIMGKNPDYVAEVPNNMAHRYMSGKLTRNRIIPVTEGIQMVEICGNKEEPQMITIDPKQDRTGINQHGVVMNFACAWGSLGRLYVKPYDAAISNSIVLLKTDTHEQSVLLLNYLQSEDVKAMVKDNMASFHPTKSLFKTIPDITFNA